MMQVEHRRESLRQARVARHRADFVNSRQRAPAPVLRTDEHDAVIDDEVLGVQHAAGEFAHRQDADADVRPAVPVLAGASARAAIRRTMLSRSWVGKGGAQSPLGSIGRW